MKNKEIVRWWEQKRKIYNILLIAFSILGIISNYRNHSENELFSTYSLENDIIFLLIWLIGANIFYCLGMGTDLTFKYYGGEFPNSLRYALLIFGILISIFWTAFNLMTP